MTGSILICRSPAEKTVEVYASTDLESRFEPYLHDESKLVGQIPSSISFPRSTEEVSSLFRRFFEADQQIVLSGSRTGLCGGASPSRGCHLVSLERMKQIGNLREQNGQFEITVEGGVTLQELQSFLEKTAPAVFFPVDPTETGASIGGAVGTNASGARSLFYGSIRNWVTGLKGVLSSGHSFSIKRGEVFIGDDGLLIKRGDSIEELVAERISHPACKSTAGYKYGPGQDLIDLFVGSEGTLAAFTEVTLKLAERPRERLYYLQFLKSEEEALKFAIHLSQISAHLLALEYFDKNSLSLLRKNESKIRSRAVKLIRQEYEAAVFCDFALQSALELETTLEDLTALLSDLSISSENSLAASEDRDLRDIKVFRHAVPEQINSIVAERKRNMPALHKISTDMSVPQSKFQKMLEFYRSQLTESGLEHYIFGHLGEFHLHVNIVPRSNEELLRAKELYRVFAEKTVSLGGAVAAEHGIGRIKKHLLSLQYSDNSINSMRLIKKFFDPRFLLNRGVIFDP